MTVGVLCRSDDDSHEPGDWPWVRWVCGAALAGGGLLSLVFVWTMS